MAPYLEVTEDGPKLQEWLAKIDRAERRSIEFLVDLLAAMFKDIAYGIRLEPGVQTCEETLTLGQGSCRDTAWLLVQVLRNLGLAARFVSGYLVQLTSDVKSLDGPSGPEEDFTDLHAWVEVFLPGAGWVGLDPTSGLFADEGHIPLACTPHYASATPVSGATSKCEVKFEFSNTVDRIVETPRVTKPYTEEQWSEIDQLGDAVDKVLEAGDGRRTHVCLDRRHGGRRVEHHG
ncbi:MAG: transglutaminase-like putative cysteine protease [Verrucomicrobiales bacterium]